MKIGKLVKSHIPGIFAMCEKAPGELPNLMDKKYSKEKFGVNFPFCMEVDSIRETLRFWSNEYHVCGKTVRVTSQWFAYNQFEFVNYLVDKKIISKADAANLLHSMQASNAESAVQIEQKRDAALARQSSLSRRYRAHAIGNSQNGFIRYILGRLEDESFSEKDWQRAIIFFGGACAYCGAKGELVIDHAIPINREYLGEHKLGNLVSACRDCNSRKAGNDYREFLFGETDRLERIKEHMHKNNYAPLRERDNFQQLQEVFDMAYKELVPLADRYIRIINCMLTEKEK